MNFHKLLPLAYWHKCILILTVNSQMVVTINIFTVICESLEPKNITEHLPEKDGCLDGTVPDNGSYTHTRRRRNGRNLKECGCSNVQRICCMCEFFSDANIHILMIERRSDGGGERNEGKDEKRARTKGNTSWEGCLIKSTSSKRIHKREGEEGKRMHCEYDERLKRCKRPKVQMMRC